jgi:hypothetical protein
MKRRNPSLLLLLAGTVACPTERGSNPDASDAMSGGAASLACVGGGSGACSQPGLTCEYSGDGSDSTTCCCVAVDNMWSCYPMGNECGAAHIRVDGPCCGPGLTGCPTNEGTPLPYCICSNHRWTCE